MKTRDEEQLDADVAHLVRGILFGDSLRNATIAAVVGIVVSLCLVVVQFAFIQPSFQPTDFRWSLTGIISILFWICLFVIVAVHSYTGGGLVDCCLILIAPAFIAHLTFLSVAPTTGGPVPIWEWSFGEHFIPYIRTAIYGALLWGIGLGVLGFVSGAVLRIASRVRTG